MSTVQSAPQQAAPARLVWVFSGLSALLASGYGVLFTMGGDYRENYGISESTFGFIIGVGFILAFFAQLLLGPLGDRGYARIMVFGGAAVNTVGLLMMGFGTSATVLIAGRVISGIAVGAANPAIKRMVVVGSGPNLGRNLGRLFSADVFGFALGPIISTVLVPRYGISAPFIVIAALTLIMVAASLHVQVGDSDTRSAEIPAERFAFDLLRQRAFAGAVMIGVAAYIMIGAFDVLWDLVHTDLNTNPTLADLGITLFAVPLVLLGPTSGKLAQRVGPFRVAGAGMLAAAVFFGLYGLLTAGSVIFVITMFHALTDGLSFSASGVAIGMTAPESRQASAQGVLGGMQALGAGLMAPFTGVLYEAYGQRTAYWTAAVIIAALVLGGLALARPAIGMRG